MGMYVDTTIGYGILLPFTGDSPKVDLSDWKFPPESQEWLSKYIEWDEKHEYAQFVDDDEWEFYEALSKKFPGTSYNVQSVYEYSRGTVFFSQNGSKNLDPIDTVDLSELNITAEDAKTIWNLRNFLGIQETPDIYVITSFT